ncbi:MAG: mechanosensitive ion channel [Leptolyngbyaceae cyanobacterium MO_188.B28]|nr:mechanosensitive ion channel [Leptolyngbyaceae cyanobacterium MO_188.B28]
MEGLESMISTAQELATRFGLNIIAAIVIFIVGGWAAKIIRRIIKRLMSRGGADPLLVSFGSTITYYAVMAFVVIAALNRLGIQTASFVAVLGAAGLAIGLALQGSLANFAAGALMIIFRPFKVGDLIEGGGVLGVVEEIQLFTTVLKTPENKTVIIPNGKLGGDNIINYSAQGALRVDLVVGVSYDADIDRVKHFIKDVLSQDSRILTDPAPTVAVMELGDNSVNFAVRPWTEPSNNWDVYFATYEAVKKRLDAEGISIPFPQRDVHIFQHN